MTEASRAEFADAVQDAGAALPPGCQQGFARLAKLIRARPHKFQLLIMDCRDETLRDRLIANLDELLQVSGGRTTRLRLSAKDHPTFAAVERALTRLAETNVAIHVTGGPAWFDTKRWGAFNIRRDAVAHEVRTSLLLWLDEDSIADLARVAIDLWAWRTSVITFTTAPQRLTMREPDIRAIDDRTRDERATRIEFLHQTLLEPDIPEDMRLGFALEMGDLAASLGRVAEAESAYRAAVAAATDERSRAVTMGRIADILQARGALDEALRIRREEELPVYERLGDMRSRAVTMGKIADILQARGALDEALRIRREEQLPVYERLGDIRERAVTMGRIADILQARGALDEALRIRREEELPVYERLGDVRAARRHPWARSPTSCRPAAQLDEALRIRREEQLPVYERLGDIRERAVTMGKIADILQARGRSTRPCASAARRSCRSTTRLGDIRSPRGDRGQDRRHPAGPRRARRGPAHPPRGGAAGLRAPRRRALPRGDDGQDRRHPAGPRRSSTRPCASAARSSCRSTSASATSRERAVTMGKIADILQARGALDEALRIRREEELPVYERLGDVRSRAVTMGRIADILQARGALDEALRIRREEELPVYERLGDVRSRAVTMGKIADILQARGALDEALRIRREEELPVYERLGDVRERAVTMGKIADIL